VLLVKGALISTILSKTSILYLVNGILSWYSYSYVGKGYELVDTAVSTPISYLPVVIIFLFGAFVLKESIFLTDIIGVCTIVGFNIYNSLNPP